MHASFTAGAASCRLAATTLYAITKKLQVMLMEQAALLLAYASGCVRWSASALAAYSLGIYHHRVGHVLHESCSILGNYSTPKNVQELRSARTLLLCRKNERFSRRAILAGVAAAKR